MIEFIQISSRRFVVCRMWLNFEKFSNYFFFHKITTINFVIWYTYRETLRFSEVFLATSDYSLSKRNRRYTVATIGSFYCSGFKTFCNFVVKYPNTHYNTKSVKKIHSAQEKFHILLIFLYNRKCKQYYVHGCLIYIHIILYTFLKIIKSLSGMS